jgi:osmoprotectant transport system substrate-binding protein
MGSPNSPALEARISRRTLLAGLLAASMPAGCRSTRREASRAPGPRDEVVVASFNFSESAVVAEIYSLALEERGIPVGREKELGPRELVHPALFAGLVDVVPEYLGTALASVEPASPVDRTDSAALHRSLETALAPRGFEVRAPAPAQNQNGFALLRPRADRLHLRTLSNLAAVAGGLTLGGPPECPRRAYCAEGLARVYGVHFGRFQPFDSEHQRIAALEQEVVDVAVVFSTDGRLASGDLLLLEDDRRLQPAENIVPIVSRAATERHGPALGATLDAVSARLTTNSLTFLNWRVGIGAGEVASEARGWLQREGLVARPR